MSDRPPEKVIAAAIDRHRKQTCLEIQRLKVELIGVIIALVFLAIVVGAGFLALCRNIGGPATPRGTRSIEVGTNEVHVSTDTKSELRNQPVLTTAEYATLHGVHIDTVYNRIRSGDLPSRKVGNRYEIPNASAENRQKISRTSAETTETQ